MTNPLPSYDAELRAAMFRHLDHLLLTSPDGSLPSSLINTFTFQGKAVPLAQQQGIVKPSGLTAALTIRTRFTPPNEVPLYEDRIGEDGLPRYKYQGEDPDQWDNRALREAMVQQVPLVYLVGVDRGVYVPYYPVRVRAEDRARHEFTIAVDEGQRFIDLDTAGSEKRAYVERLTRTRLHQQVFRARVLRAYRESCAMCRLHHSELLDAAHIIPDGQPHGEPVVPNGLALCKIHHAAYDGNILGVRPDLVIEVAPKVLGEIDGPMLRHGLQEMAGVKLVTPQQRLARPDPDRLAVRYDEFRQAG